jgi:hypothetical protein
VVESRKKTILSRPAPIKGSAKLTGVGGSIKATPRVDRSSFFLGRLDKETSEEALKDYLASVGVDDCVCRKLKSKGDKEFSTAAFYISCVSSLKDKIFCGDIWPEGAELREWVFMNAS